MVKNFQGAIIRGIASVLPKKVVEIDGYKDVFGANTVDRIINLTGINRVHIADSKTSSDYCVEASKKLMSKLNIESNKIDALIFVTQTPDYIIPHTSAIMQNELGLRKDIIALDVNFGCAGYVYGLFQAFSFINSKACKNVLLCCGDTLSKCINKDDKALRLVMGDAGTATIISSTDVESNTFFDFYCDGSRAKELIISAGSNRNPHISGITDEALIDEYGNFRSQEDLYMNGMEIMNFALGDVKAMVNLALKEAGVSKDSIELFCFHQANETIVKYLAKVLRIPISKVPISVKENGNTSSCSIPLMLCNLYSGDDVSLGKILMCGFGTGLAAGVCCIDLKKLVICATEEL